MEKMTVWKDRSNWIEIELKKDGTTLTSDEIDAITKVELKYKDVYYDSTTYTDAFDLVTGRESGKLIIKPGLLDWEAGSDVVELIVYDAANTNGVMWMQIGTQVRADAEVAV